MLRFNPNCRWQRARFNNDLGGETPPKPAGQRPALRSADVLACGFQRRLAAGMVPRAHFKAPPKVTEAGPATLPFLAARNRRRWLLPLGSRGRQRKHTFGSIGLHALAPDLSPVPG